MFQRSTPRQVGFIRTRNNSQNRSCRIDPSFTCNDGFQTLHFSPFKDSSPEPIHSIIQSYRHKQNKRVHKQKQFLVNPISTSPIFQKNYQSIGLFQSTSQTNPVQSRIKKIQKNTQQTLEDNYASFTVSADLSLAQAFEIKCKRMKQRLEYERKKFSRSKNKITLKSQPKIRQNQGPQELIKKISDPQRYQKTDRRKYQSRKSDENNKQNMPNRNNQEEPKQKQIKKIEIPNQKIGGGTKFFIPAPSNRSKPITPRQAYQHSLKKWKQLPEVVAKQKQKAKERQLRERLSKMKAHSMSVRDKMRR